ncbi:MAG: tetratricopeptide repeat protein, partial [Verrucomicrobiia bacterium]
MSSYASQAQLVVDIARNPLDLRAWQDLMMIFIGQRDQASIASLQLITKSLGQLQEAVEAGHVRLLPSQIALLASMASRPNDSSILKRVGLMFQHEFNLSGVSSRYFVRALELNPGDPELAQLSSASLNSAVEAPGIDHLLSSRRLPTVVSQAAPLDARTAISRSVKIDPKIIEKIQARKKSGPQAPPATAARQSAALNLSHLVNPNAKTTPLEVALRELNKETMAAKPLPPAPSGLQPAQPPVIKRPATANMQAEIHHAAAKRALAEGHRDEALHELRKAQVITKRIPRINETWIEVGQQYHREGNLPLAIECYQNATKSKPDSAEGWFLLAAAYQEDGQTQAAFDAYDEVVQLDPQHARGWCNMGVLCFEVQDYEQAVFCCEQATLARPDYAKAWDNLGVALSVLGRLEPARQAFEKAVHHRPDLTETWFRLGSIYAEEGNYPEAVAALQRCLEQAPEHWEAATYLGSCLVKQGKLNEAYEILDRVAEGQPELDHLHTVLNELGLAIRRAGDPQRAIEVFLRVIENNPGLPEVWFNLGVAMDKAGQAQGAMKSFRQAVKLLPEFTMAWNNLGTLYLEQDLNAEAVEVFETVTRLEPRYAKG